MEGSDGSTAWLQETTRSGIDRPTEADESLSAAISEGSEPETRAVLVETQGAMSRFSSFAFKTDGTLYYNNVASSNRGQLEERQIWKPSIQLRFYAVHPYAAEGITAIANGPAVSFTVNSNVMQQQDLMYASTGVLDYRDDGVAPLNFKHALTAVSFQLGTITGNGGDVISSITLKNVYTTGTLTQPSDDTQEGGSNATATWSNLGDKQDITLSGLNVAVSAENSNHAVTSATQNFLMIPQDLNGVAIEIGFTSGKTISSTLTSGSWQPGTTKGYSFSMEIQDWEYQLTVTAPAAITYNATTTGNYSITSYKQKDSGQEAVAWTITKYEYSDDNGATWTDNGTSKPAWLTALSKESGAGSTSAATGIATVDANSYIIDKKAARDNVLKNAATKTDYDLSMGGETANCYVISAPGTYKIPLVYGNARNANGTANTVCFNTAPFCDYQGNQLTQMNIKDVSASTTADLVWKDVSTDIVTDLAVDVTNNFLTFTVSSDALQQGNAVVGIKNGDDYLWSWHLWFADAEALEVTTVNNASNQPQGFTRDNLGFVYDSWNGSTYEQPRKVRITVTQSEAKSGQDAKTAQIVITQNNGALATFHDTKYQFGRKDAFSGTTMGAPLTAAGKTTYANVIKNPGTFYTSQSGNWCSTNYNNAWAVGNIYIDNTVATSAVVKSVYDPCPAGFKMRGTNAFIGLTSNISRKFFSYSPAYGGYYITEGGNTVFFPCAGSRDNSNGAFYSVCTAGFYWAAAPASTTSQAEYAKGMGLGLYEGGMVTYSYDRASGFSVRPVQAN